MTESPNPANANANTNANAAVVSWEEFEKNYHSYGGDLEESERLFIDALTKATTDTPKGGANAWTRETPTGPKQMALGFFFSPYGRYAFKAGGLGFAAFVSLEGDELSPPETARVVLAGVCTRKDLEGLANLVTIPTTEGLLDLQSQMKSRPMRLMTESRGGGLAQVSPPLNSTDVVAGDAPFGV